MDGKKLALAAEEVPAVPFAIPGATGEFRIQLLNEDTASGVVTSIIHLPPGGRIPAHSHRAGAEMHYVLEGDLVEAGRSLGPGAFLTHAAGQVHGPHESRSGAKVLTVQSWQSRDGSYDFEPAGEEMMAEAGAKGGQRRGADPRVPNQGAPKQGGMRKVDEGAQQAARQDESLPEAKGYS
ncbi:cupin domain-containing protein [Falsiroseomonas sp. HW251]|uniref:cupin domain-containing protein n=1 Tax=Falsiroseomonas sp. HW251 TaxID=3390998 RepID=UPI003D31E9EC